MRTRWQAVVVVAALALLGARPAGAFSVAYDQTVQSAMGNAKSKVLLKDENFRVENEIQGKTQILIRNSSGMFAYFPEEGMAMRMASADQPVAVANERAADYMGYLKSAKAQLVGSETMNGYPCDVYVYTDEQGGGQQKVWVWKEKGFPVRVETQSPQQGNTVINLTNIKFDPPAPASAFSLPQGVQVMDMGNMMNMQGMLEGMQEGREPGRQ